VQEFGAGPPLLFLHGGPAAGTIFAPLASQLQDFRCILLNHPGCAFSPAINYKKRRLDDLMADIVTSCLDALGLKRVPIVTSSFGGACAFWVVQCHPDRVARIVHMGCPAFVSQMQAPFIMKLLATPGLGYLATRLPMNRSGVLSFMKTMGQQHAIATDRLPDAFFDWWIALAQDTSTMRNERELIRHGLTWRGPRPELMIADALIQELKHPMYFYWGTDDPFATARFAANLVRGMPNARIDFVHQSGHLPWFDNWQDAAMRVRVFLLERDEKQASLGTTVAETMG
jgi:pimeloyl-ACP methyl ester carboxylesterase